MKLLKFAFIAIMGLTVALTSCNKSDVMPTTDDTSALNDFLFLATAGDSTVTGGKHGKGCHLTQVAVADLPAVITSYITTNYAGSTIKNAGTDSLSNYIVLVTLADASHIGLKFDSAGTFVSVLAHKGKGTAVLVADLPAAITTYVSSTYAGSTIEHAMKDTAGNYMLMVVKADGTKVGLGFDSAGVFKSELTVKGKGGKGGKGKGH